MRKKKIPAIACPHCQSPAGVRTSDQQTPLIRDARLICENDECGHVFIVQISIVRTIAPSLIPNPAISIPGGNQDLRRQRQRPDNDNHPAPANDDMPDTAIVHDMT